MSPPARTCCCGHDEAAHEHWRDGADCGRCGAVRCPAFRSSDGPPPVSPELRRLLAVLTVVVLVAVAVWLGPAAVALALAVIAGTAAYLLVRD